MPENSYQNNLDAIIAVGYRINSKRATAFRQWATGVLRDYALRGYIIDKKRMENGTFLNEDYFEHLLAEIRAPQAPFTMAFGMKRAVRD
jgi:hypothetical protein